MDQLDTTSLHDLIARFRSGETSALDSLIRRTEQRLELFARRMLQRFPGVAAREETTDVLQSALIRLTRALRQETPASVQDFFGLAAAQIRRELLDLARKHARRPAVQLMAADDLCRDCPDLLPEAERQIAVLRQFHILARPEAATAVELQAERDTAHGERGGTAPRSSADLPAELARYEINGELGRG